MRRKKLLTLIGSVCLALVLAALPFMAACPAPEEDGDGGLTPTTTAPAPAALEVIKWRSGDFLPAMLPSHIEGISYFCDMTKELTNGQLEITSYGAGEIVGPLEVASAVSEGVLDCGQWFPPYDMGSIPATGLIGCRPFGLTESEMPLWWEYGGGKELTNEIYGGWNMKALLLNVGGAQILGHWREPIDSLAKMKGKIVRSSGLAAKVYGELGINTKVLPSSELYTAVERGVIDCAEFGDPGLNWSLGLHEVAPYILLPGWHEPATLIVLLINKNSWEALPNDLQRAVELAAQLTVRHCQPYMDWDAVVGSQKMKDYGCTFMRLSDEDLATIDAATARVLDGIAVNDPVFAEVLQSQRDIKEKTKLCKSLGDLSYK